MRVMKTSPLAGLLLCSLSTAQEIVDSLTFGHHANIIPSLPGWTINEVNHHIQYLSDRLILTPPFPGNTKSTIWSEGTSTTPDWSAELEFRASGDEGGSGSLQLWYTRNRGTIDSSSINTVERFEGLVIVIDQYGGQGGSIRGFLNDGSSDYRTQKTLESLAFGHCSNLYRNIGRFSVLRVRHQNGLSVSIDGETCFSTEHISLPGNYYFGITASTRDPPDSFEVRRFAVSALPAGYTDAAPPTDANSNPESDSNSNTILDSFPGSPQSLPDTDADTISDSAAQFADLHNRIQGMNHQLANLFNELSLLRGSLGQQHEKTLSQIANLQGSKETGLPPETVGTINRLNDRMTNLERVLEDIKRDVSGKDYRIQLDQLSRDIQRVHGGVHEHLPERIGDLLQAAAPKMGLFVGVILAVQALLVAAYIVYKRRRNGMPKKYL